MLSRLSARSRQRRVARDLTRRMAELDRLDRLHGLGAMPTRPPASGSAPRRGPGQRGTLLLTVIATATVLGALVTLSPSDDMVALRRMVGLDDDRLAAVPQVAQGVGTYRFLQTQQHSDEPVAYDPCRPVEVAVNPEGAPHGYDELVDTGLAHAGDAAGLQFVRVGLTDDRPGRGEGTARRRPVLVAWATSQEVPELAGDVAGVGGSVAAGPPGRVRYVTGQVVLDRDLFASLGTDGAASAQAVVDHELGHLVGLDHVDDTGELMHPRSSIRTTYGPGDLEGLARLGGVDC